MNRVIHEGEVRGLRVEHQDGVWYLVTEYDGSYTVMTRLANTREEVEERLAEAAAGIPLVMEGLPFEPMPVDTPEVEAWTKGEKA